MSRRNRSILPPNRKLRRAVIRLLLSAPVLPALGCGGNSGDCPRWTNPRVFNDVRFSDGGTPGSSLDCTQLCKEHYATYYPCTLELPTDGGTNTLSCGSRTCNDGRRPEGLVLREVEAGCALGALYAQMGYLEAASVPAFLRLADELTRLGAPEALVRAARRSAGDEVRHARVAEALARAHGARVPEVERADFGPRSLEAIALENAVEGCVRELFGALVTGWQARAAGDEVAREALGPIAEDELRHAELAWAVDAWAMERLPSVERDRIREAQRQVLRQLVEEVSASEPAPELVQRAGLPSREASLRLLDGIAVLVA